MERHGGAQLSQVGVHLSVRKPENGNPEEDTAGTETTANLINPGIIEVVPRRLASAEMRWLDLVPHSSVVPVSPCLDWVDGETSSESLEKQLEGRAHDVTRRWLQDVELLADIENWQADNEHDRGNEVGQPETDITFSVDHTKLASQSANIDEEVEVVVDAGDGDSGINNDTLAITDLNAHTLLGYLLGNKGRNVGLEGTGSETHDDQTDDEGSERAVGLGQNRGGRRSDEDDVTDFSDDDRVDNGLEATEVGVSNPCSEERSAVDPEGIEGGQTEGDLLAHVKSTGLSIVTVGVQSSTSGGDQRLCDEIGVDGNGSIVGHALDQLNKGNL